MNRSNNERLIILLISIGCIGLSIESLMLGWEFWVPPLLMVGAVSLWGMHITGNPEYKVRQVACLVYVMLMVFYHGVHGTSYYDVAIVIVLVMVALSLLNHIYILNLLFVEYWIVLGIQLYLAGKEKSVPLDTVNISRRPINITKVATHLAAAGRAA